MLLILLNINLLLTCNIFNYRKNCQQTNLQLNVANEALKLIFEQSEWSVSVKHCYRSDESYIPVKQSLSCVFKTRLTPLIEQLENNYMYDCNK